MAINTSEEFYVDLNNGFSDVTLELLCDENYIKNDKKLGYSSAHWMFWTTEIYSFGRCYREWLGWKKWLPIPVYGDHGPDPEGKLYDHEISNQANIHLCHFSGKLEGNKNNKYKKRLIQIPHPWVIFRKKHNIKLSQSARGTIVFFPHTVPGIDFSDSVNIENYVNELQNLPEEYHPICICLHMHDVYNGTHKELRKYGIPLFSAGNTSSAYFVERFYKIVVNFEYATSNTGGSEIYYCSELGNKFFLYGTKFNYVNKSHDQLPLGKVISSDPKKLKADEKKKSIFSIMPPALTKERMDWVEDVMGLNVDEGQARKLLKRVFLIEMIRLLPFYIVIIFNRYLNSLLRLGR